MKSFVYIITGRCGSHCIQHSINEIHPEVWFFKEMLNYVEVDQRDIITEKIFSGTFQDCSFFKDYERLINIKTNVKTVGFNLGAWILPKYDLCSLIKKYNSKILYGYRSNLVRNAISNMNVKVQNKYSGMKNSYHIYLDQALDYKVIKFKVDLDVLDSMIRQLKRYEVAMSELIKNSNTNYLKIEYEYFEKNPNKCLNEILDFLGVTKIDIPLKTIKTTSRNLREVLKNFDEVKDWAIQNGYSGMLD